MLILYRHYKGITHTLWDKPLKRKETEKKEEHPALLIGKKTGGQRFKDLSRWENGDGLVWVVSVYCEYVLFPSVDNKSWIN